MNKLLIKENLVNDIQHSLRSALNIHNLEIKIKNLVEAVDIASTLLDEVRKEEKVHDILYYVDISFNILVSPQKLYAMTYLYEIYDDSFFSGIEDNKENFSESNMRFSVQLFDFKFFSREMSKEEFEEKVKLVEEIFTRSNVNAKRVSSSIPPIDEFEFIYPLDTEVFWFLL